MATTFEFRDEDGNSLSDIARLDTMVTVVDAARIAKDYSSQDFLKDRGETAGPEDERTIVDLLVDQIEFADVIVLNKIDMVTSAELGMARAIVRALNADARIIDTSESRVALRDVLDTGLFSFETARTHPTWLKELQNFKSHTPERDELRVAPQGLEIRNLKDELRQVGVLGELADAAIHVGGVDRDLLAGAVGGREGDVVQHALHNGLQAARADVLDRGVDQHRGVGQSVDGVGSKTA